MADQRSPGSRRTGTGRFAPHQLQARLVAMLKCTALDARTLALL